ncbi:MAG: chromosomal replication initiator protein DnaA [Verrucomicrobiota bacterium]
MAKKCEQPVNESLPLGNLTDLWTQICKEIAQISSPSAVERWFNPLQLHEVTEQTFTLVGGNLFAQSFIEDNFKSQLQTAITRVLGAPRKIAFQVQENPAPTPTPTVQVIQESQKDPEPSGLNPRFTFDSFVVGTNCEFAHAAALGVAQSPARTYNPLFLYGSVGLGKTHLMQAIGHQLQKKKGFKVVYVTSEHFANEFIAAIQKNELTKFRKKYRQVDCLLIDDVQFLGGKEKSQEEFFHTFNSVVVDGHKQIVLSSDLPPSELNGLEKRLVSRFDWGMTAQLCAPDVETRTAILRQKLANMQVTLSDEVLTFIAQKIRSNIRRLEGALTRVAGYGSLINKKLTVTQVEPLLKDLIKIESEGRVTFDSVMKKVSETYDIRPGDMTSKRKPANIVLPRMIAMHLCRRLTQASLKEIGEAFGGRDHGTILHADKKIREKIEKDPQFSMQIQYLAEKLSTETK